MRGGRWEVGKQLRKVHLKGRNEEQIEFVRMEKSETSGIVIVVI